MLPKFARMNQSQKSHKKMGRDQVIIKGPNPLLFKNELPMVGMQNGLNTSF